MDDSQALQKVNKISGAARYGCGSKNPRQDVPRVLEAIHPRDR